MLASADTPPSVVAALPSDLLLLVAAAAAVLAWTAVRRRGLRSGTTSRVSLRLSKSRVLPPVVIGPDGHLDDESKAKLAA